MIKKKIDRRMHGYGTFRYIIEFNTREVEQFHKVREWCWDQWGSSGELKYHKKLAAPNPVWAWHTDEYSDRIYIADDKEYAWFVLRWI
jgi:hypothetical protein